MWEKFKSEFARHPYIFIGVAVAVIIFFFWGGGSSKSSGTSGISAEMATAIATSAQANAQLQADQYALQGQEAGFNAAVTINDSNNSTAYSIAQLQSATAQYAIGQQTSQATIASQTLQNHDNFVLASQNSAEDWITHLETAHLGVPTNLVTSGLVDVSNTTANAIAAKAKTTGVQALGNFNPGSNGMQGAGNSTNPSNSGGDGTVGNN